MDFFDKAMSILGNPKATIWGSERKLGKVRGVDVLEYSVRLPEIGDLVVQGLNTNNPQVRYGKEALIILNGQHIKCDEINKYDDLFTQLGYRYQMQLMRVKENIAGR